jgi:flavorubredoxin
MRKILEQEKFEIWEKELPVQFVPDPEELKNAIQFGRDFAYKALGK